MRNPAYSSVDPENGNVSWCGPLSIEPGDHSGMPHKTDAYLPGDERGHINASSLGGTNGANNIAPQQTDVNHGAYYSMEAGERSALKSGATVESEKTAIVDSQPGNRPSTFMVNDTVCYPDGHTEELYHSFTNESYADQTTFNELSATLPGTFDDLNPGDELRSSMSGAEYADLMQSTDAELPGISEDYAAADFSGIPASDISDEIIGSTSDIISEGIVIADDNCGVDSDVDV